ncbi:MAG: septum formation initiator family protein [Fibrobacteria bacterium]|nr:septum formation initiator family protein [Fibrobacteria bacterium]
MQKKKKWLRWVFVLFLVWVGYSWLSGNSGIINQVRLYQENKELQSKLDSLETVKKEIDVQRARLRSDKFYLEKVIREELGMAKPEEKVYRLRK